MISTIDIDTRLDSRVYDMYTITLSLDDEYVVSGIESVSEIAISHPIHDMLTSKRYSIKFSSDYGLIESKTIKGRTLLEVISFIMGTVWMKND